MKARQCAGCAAPLPDSDPGATVTCRFCGMVHDPVGGAAAAQPIKIDIRQPVAVSGRKAGIFLALLGIAVLVPIVIVVVAMIGAGRVVRSAIDSATTTTTPAAAHKSCGIGSNRLGGSRS